MASQPVDDFAKIFTSQWDDLPRPDEQTIVAQMFRQLYQPKDQQALAIKKYNDIVASRIREKLQSITEDPVPKTLSQKDIDHLCHDDTKGDKYGIKRRAEKERADHEIDRAASKAMDQCEITANFDCTICGRFFSRRKLMPMKPMDHDWRGHIRICFTCARGTTPGITDQPIVVSYTGYALDQGLGTDSLFKDLFPIRKPDDWVHGWESAIPGAQTIHELQTKSFNRSRFFLEFAWRPHEMRWVRSTFRPDMPSDTKQAHDQVMEVWAKDCHQMWEVRRAMLNMRGRRARGVDWKDMIDYFRRLYPGVSNNQRAILAAKRACTMVDAMMTSYESIDRKSQIRVLQVFSIHSRECEIMRIDIAITIRTIDEELLGHAYAMGFATKIMADINLEWLCRNPDCCRLIKATQWLRNVEGSELEAIIHEHGQFWCPACCKLYRPWVDMPGSDPDEAKAKLARDRMNQGFWDPSRLIPANKAYLIKNSIGFRSNTPDLVGSVDSAAARTVDFNGDQWLVFLAEWPEITVEKLADRLKLITNGLVQNPPRSQQELAEKIYQRAVTDDNNKSVHWEHATMTEANIQKIKDRNWGAKKAVRLDLATDSWDQKIHYDFLPFKFVAGQTTVMHMDEQLELFVLMKTQLMAAAEALDRSSKL